MFSDPLGNNPTRKLRADEVDRMTKQGTTIPNENMTLNNFEQNLRRKSEAMETVQSQYETKIIRLESTITQLRGTIKQNEKLLELSYFVFFVFFVGGVAYVDIC